MGARPSSAGVVVAIGIALAVAAPVRAQDAAGGRTVTVVPSARYAASALSRVVFGRDYRALWTTPIEVEVLDLERTAGGLEPVMIVGRNQTLGLALRGADGNAYTFRSLDKDPTAVLPPELLGTPIADLAQDQISSNFPGAPLVAGSIADAAGVLESRERLVVMPDSQRLGEFREQFAGLLGTFFEYPTDGTWGAERILDGAEMIELLTVAPAERIDARAFLRARLLDHLIGDWDRHVGQWRWARLPGAEGWQPIAEDRDQAFSRYDGIAMSFQRNRDPRFDVFRAGYQALEGLTWNGRTVDRRLLTGLGREDFRQVAEDLRERLGDDVLADAVRELPAPWHQLAGADLLARLEARRDGLVAHAERYYEFLAAEVDVWGSEAAERFTIERLESGGVEVTVAALEGPSTPDCRSGRAAAPRYRRSFTPEETGQVRVYVGAGDDRVVVSGDGPGRIDVRVVAAGGDNRLCVGGAATVPFGAGSAGRDGSGPEVAEGIRLAPAQPLRDAGTPVDQQGAPKDARRDWGSTTYTTPWLAAGPDIGLFGGIGWTREVFGFRKRPFAAQHTVRVGFSTGALRPRLEYTGVYHLENRAPFLRARASVSGIDTLNFFGIGNETQAPEDSDLRRALRTAVDLATAYVRPLGEKASLSTGPIGRFSHTRRDADDLRLVNVLAPYGVEDVAQVGWTAGFHVNRRDPVRVQELKETDDPTRFGWPVLGAGVTLDLDVTYYPELLDLTEDYLVLEGVGTATTRLGGGPAVGIRVGGQRNRGRAPYYDLAVVGEDEVRGLASGRFAGDASLYGNLLVAVPIGRTQLVIPGYWGVLGMAGTGRVWIDGEDSSRWHWGAGGGIWWAPWDYATALRVTVADSDDGLRAHVRLGFDF